MTDGSGVEPDGLELARASVRVLVNCLPPERRKAAWRRYADLLEREFRQSGLEPPEWIGRLRDQPWEGSERE